MAFSYKTDESKKNCGYSLNNEHPYNPQAQHGLLTAVYYQSSIPIKNFIVTSSTFPSSFHVLFAICLITLCNNVRLPLRPSSFQEERETNEALTDFSKY